MSNDIIQSAELGDKKAAYRAGRMFRDGDGVDADYSKAIYYYEKAANDGVSQAKVELALLLIEMGSDDTDKIVSLITDAMETNLNAKYQYAKMCQEGKFVLQDLGAAEAYYRELISNGNEKAKYELAEMLRKDLLSERRMEAGILFYELAVDGNKNAMFRLYLMYKSENGIRKDKTMANKWLKCAADAGHNKAIEILLKKEKIV